MEEVESLESFGNLISVSSTFTLGLRRGGDYDTPCQGSLRVSAVAVVLIITESLSNKSSMAVTGTVAFDGQSRPLGLVLICGRELRFLCCFLSAFCDNTDLLCKEKSLQEGR